MMKRLLLGPEKLTLWHHIGVVLAWGIFVLGFGGWSWMNGLQVLVLYAISIGVFYGVKWIEKLLVQQRNKE